MMAFIFQIIPHSFLKKELCSTYDQIDLLSSFPFSAYCLVKVLERIGVFMLCELHLTFSKRRRKKWRNYEQLGIKKKKWRGEAKSLAQQQHRNG